MADAQLDDGAPAAARTRRRSTRILRVLGMLVVAVLVALSGLAAYHHLTLAGEAEQLQPPGTMVEVDGRAIHVYAEGPSSEVTLVFLSGAGTIAPVYDFQPLTSLLSDEFRVVIVEKAGYGYSDLVDTPRDLDALVAEVRAALALAGESGPYVLLPHSMSGLEALWWSRQYPDEVAGIVGLDMSIPEGYANENATLLALGRGAGQVATWLGIHRIPGLYPGFDVPGLTAEQAAQHELLLHRNAGNIAQIREGEQVLQSAALVGEGFVVSQPMMLFASASNPSVDWLRIQGEFAARNGATLIPSECGHSVHHCDAELIAEMTRVLVQLVTIG